VELRTENFTDNSDIPLCTKATPRNINLLKFVGNFTSRQVEHLKILGIDYVTFMSSGNKQDICLIRH